MQGLGPAFVHPTACCDAHTRSGHGGGSREALGSSAAEQASKRPPNMLGHTWKGVMANTSDLSAAKIGGIGRAELPSDPRRLPSPCAWRRLVPAQAALTCASPSPVPALTRDPRAPAADEVPDENCVPPGPYLRHQRGMLTLCQMTAAADVSSYTVARLQDLLLVFGSVLQIQLRLHAHAQLREPCRSMLLHTALQPAHTSLLMVAVLSRMLRRQRGSMNHVGPGRQLHL